MYPYIDWEKEPDLDSLRLAYSQFAENPEKSLGVLQELASRGSVASMWYLGDAFASGAHLQKDMAQAQFWFAKADEAGWIPAPYMRGRVAFASGDYKKAFDDFSRGASKAHTPAVYRLAMMYKDGRGTNKNITAARDLLELAARHGHLFAKRDLASLHISGVFGRKKAIVGFLMLFRLALDIVCIAILGSWRRVGFEDTIMA
jgi:TPR repeat protein